MIEQVPWWAPLVAYGTGWLMGRIDRDTQDDWRRRFNHENKRGPVGTPPFRLRRTIDVTWKDPPKPMTVDEWARGYQPLPSQGGTPNPPPPDP